MPTATYDLIASKTITGSAAASVIFDNIPQTYSDLILYTMESQSSSSARSTKIKINDVTSSDYLFIEADYNGTSVRSTYSTATGSGYFAYYSYATTNAFNLIARLDILGYSNTNFYKSVISRVGNAGTSTAMNLISLAKTDAITKIELNYDSVSNFNIGSTFNLYGVK